MKKWYLGESLGILQGSSCVSVGLVWTSSMVSFSTSSLCNITQSGFVCVSSRTAIFTKKPSLLFPLIYFGIINYGIRVHLCIWVFWPAGCSWCVSASVAAEPVWPLLAVGMQDLGESVPACPSQTPWGPAQQTDQRHGKPKKGWCAEIRCSQTRARAVGVPIRLRSSWEDDRKFKKCLQLTKHTALAKKGAYPHNFILQTPEEETHISCAVYHTQTTAFNSSKLIPLYLCHFNPLQFLLDHWERRRGGAGRRVSQVSLKAKVVLQRGRTDRKPSAQPARDTC